MGGGGGYLKKLVIVLAIEKFVSTKKQANQQMKYGTFTF